jgi:hypothetical protein
MSGGIVTDLGEHYRRKGVEEERARIIEWLEATKVAVAVPMVVSGDALRAQERFFDAEQKGALTIIDVLLSKLRES